MNIDAHQHFWAVARADYGWLTPELAPIYRDFGPDDLRPILNRARVDATIVVQAAPTEAETDYLLELASELDWVLGVVGWTDFKAENPSDRIGVLAERPKLVGLRPMLQDIADPGWILQAEVQPSLAAMAECGLVFDALVGARHLRNLAILTESHPDLTIVIDHAAKPAIASGEISGWASDMRLLGATTAVKCKLSGLLTEAGEHWTIADLRPYVDILLEAFGPARLIWGSDWPVLELAADYQRWRDVTHELLSDIGSEALAGILGLNACAIYGVTR